MRCTIIGLGEAGARYATALVELGHQVTGTDPAAPDTPAGVTRVPTVELAVADADVVLVMTSASVAPAVCDAALPHLRPGACYADFTSSAPAVMQQLGERVQTAGSLFADVAILGPVAWHGAGTPLMVSGVGGPVVAELLRPAGGTIDVLDEPPGSAMAHKLLRSVFMKGLASLIVEAVDAGRAAGYESWIRGQIAAQLAGDGQAVIDRLLTGTVTHAERRGHEMQDAARYLADLGVAATMTEAARSTHHRIRAASQDGTRQGSAAAGQR